MSATLTVDPKKYARLANRIVVKAIDTEEEYDHLVAAVEKLIGKGEDRLSPEESALLETMAILVQAYDDRHHPLPSVSPDEMLAYLMETSGRTANDLLPVFGTRGRVSEARSGKRSISKEQAKKLASVFKVAVETLSRVIGTDKHRYRRGSDGLNSFSWSTTELQIKTSNHRGNPTLRSKLLGLVSILDPGLSWRPLVTASELRPTRCCGIRIHLRRTCLASLRMASSAHMDYNNPLDQDKPRRPEWP